MKSIQEFEPKIIHFHSISISPYFLLYRLYNDIETVFTCHVEIEDTRQYIETVRTINKISGSFLGDKAIAISEDMKKIITNKLNFPKEKTTIISNGVNSAHFRPPTPEEKRSARQFFGLQQDDKVVCLVGRLDPVKGHDTLFSALSLLKENGLRVRAICAGSGGFDDEIKGQAVDHGVADDVIFPGFTDSRAVYWASDVNVLPSYREGFALVVPEAMLCKIPTVRTPAAGAQEQIQNGENGFIIPFDDPHALADHIRYLFENPGKRVEMGRKAQATAGEHFTLEKSIEQKISLYRSLLEG
jgi:glycosyltransferase involved in cell wall biosynthesis